jgi:hypothetical protein
MVDAARASLNRATARFILRSGCAASKGSSASPPSPNQSLAKHNRKPAQLAENKHQRPKSIAGFCRNFAPCAPPHQSLLTTHGFLIASRQLLEIELNFSQQTRKQFLIASFSGISEFAPCLTNHSSPIAPFLFDTNERARKNLTCSQQTRKQFLFDTFECYLTQPLHFEFRQSPVATVELPAYD